MSSAILVFYQIPRLLAHSWHSRRSDSSAYKLVFKGVSRKWRGSRCGNGCADCVDEEYYATSIGLLHHVKEAMWMMKFECLVLRVLEYVRQMVARELHPTPRESIDRWIASFQETMSAWFQAQMGRGFEGVFSQQVLPKPSTCTVPTKKPATACRRPSASSTSPTIKGVNKRHLKNAGNARILIADETRLNKEKHRKLFQNMGALSLMKCSYGVQFFTGHVKAHFVFQILEHPQDSHNGKPRSAPTSVLQRQPPS